MFKKVVALLMAAAMTLSMATLPAGEVKAAGKNHAAEVNVDFKSGGDETGINFWSFCGLEGNYAKNYELTYKLYFPKSMMKFESALYLTSWVYAYDDEGTDYANCNSERVDITIQSDNVMEKNGFYYVDVKLPMTQFLRWNEEKGEEEEASAPEGKGCYGLSFNISAENIDYNKSIYVDDVVLKADGVQVYSEDFEAAGPKHQHEYCINWNEDNWLKTKTVSFSGKALEVAKKALTVKVGKTVKAKATAYPAGKITYKSSNKKVATVDKNGVIKGIKKGTATITVKANGRTEKIKVTVK